MPSPKPWELQIDSDVVKELRRVPKEFGDRILHAIHQLPSDPYAGDIQKMKGEENVWRRRIGSYRFFYKLLPDQAIILVFHVERRTSTTYKDK